MNNKHNVVGTSHDRLDVRDKVTGAAVYTTDMYLPSMVMAKAVRSPYAHANIISMNKEEVEAIAGVLKVFTHEDLTSKRHCTAGYPDGSILGAAAMHKLDPSVFFDKPLIDKTVRYIGDISAVIVAETLDIAEDAARKLKIEYEILPHVVEMEDALKEDAPFVHAGTRNNVIDSQIRKGNATEAFKEADLIFEDEYFMHPQQPACMETCCTIASYEPSGKLTVWSTTQIPFNIRRSISENLNIPISKVHVIKPAIGGGFGERQMIINEILVAAIAVKICRPVKMVMSRQENLECVAFRHETKIKLKTGIMNDGKIVAYEMNVRTNAGAYTGHSVFVTRAMAAKHPYSIPNIDFNAEIVFTNRAEGAAYRGYGNPQMAYARETHFDRIAEEMNIDAIEFRKRNLVKVGEPNPVSYNSPWILQSCGIEECMDRGAKEVNWFAPTVNKEKNIYYGRGMACSLHVTGNSGVADFSSARVQVGEDGTVILSVGSADLGQGSDTAIAMICAEALGVKLEDVYMQSADTNNTSFDMGTYGSRQTYVCGNAAKLAAQKAKKELIRYACEKVKLKKEHLDIKDGWFVRVETGQQVIKLSEVAYYALYQAQDPMYLDFSASYSAVNCPPAFGVDFCELEVNGDTGEVRVISFVAAHDTGTAINPIQIEGQVEGSVIQGIGEVLTEDMVYNKDGKLLNDTMHDYKLPRAQDMPYNIKTIIVEAKEPTGPFGAKSIGEMGVAPVPGAIVNAIYDAIGVRFHKIPISKGDILNALKNK